ncbi:LOW QUALITY PROTEIN: contactin-associated protein-like 5 [Colossoma macropomum]|uniref:LOW QUALITY PROTEIN: contactin-associated protein-like 5 n=1 Tax=Colossoma macropomum TaxID=42526 RepID=UPI001864569E|nr:LOW QUALITY PROTEIN: contactin-associated protein-like 5 [Colossoma macropomum]
MGSQNDTRMLLVALLSVLTSALRASNYYCEDPLVASLPSGSFQSSSRSSDSHSAHFAKLNRKDGAGGWSPDSQDHRPWLQLDLRDRLEITAIATQGRWGSSDWVSSYHLQYSDSGRTWRSYRQDDVPWTFPGNTDTDSVVQHKLLHSVRTRYLRLVPLEGSPSGGMGLRLEIYGCTYKSDVADFDGRSALLYRFNQKSTSTVKNVISLRFRSRQAEGVLVHGEGQRGDYITLELQRGRLALHLNLDDAKPQSSGRHTSVMSGSLLDDHLWHSVLIERFNKQVNFTVDRDTQHFRTQGQEDSLEVDYELSFGGIPLPGKPGTFLRENFHGCLENLYYNGVNVIDMAKRRKPQIYTVGNVTFSCSESQPVSVTFLNSTASYLALLADPGMEGLSVRLQFRTWNRDSRLFYVPLTRGLEPASLVLQLSKGSLQLSLRGPPQGTTQVSTGRSLCDGQWHSVTLEVKAQQVYLSVDNQKPAVMEIIRLTESLQRTTMFLGGCPASQNGLVFEGSCEKPRAGYQGCLRLIFINNQPVNLGRIQQDRPANFSQLSFDICSIRDRCVPNFCEHGGVCYQSWDHFHCNCSGTGYTGATCHNPIYERSCEAYRKTGSPAGVFTVDPDGSGPLEHTQVNCTLADDKIWTVVGHDHLQPVRVQGSTPRSPYVLIFNYSISPYHLRSLVASSEHCQQEVTYRCRKSRLFDTWDGTPLSWWLDRDGVKRTYWGGILPGVQQCSCSLEGNCRDMNYFCNCDADQDAWVNDTGLLSYKDHLPLSEIAIGDTNRTGSQALFQIGPLRCYGDRFFWNSASFFAESSYLHFPTLQAELSMDISFFFKTSAPSGLFLENVGVRDFIRLELSSPSAVTFTFDLGDGPVVLTVKSPMPLNDRQWHHVRAERNVKEASLQVDLLPLQLVEAAPEGQYRLQLNSQLFVGGAPTTQRGFLGCLRALSINGMTFDLNERAKMTPGMNSGCPGHCSSDSLCHNGGRCVENRNSYVCDCTHTAFDGPKCKTAISASFERGTSLMYALQEPFSVMRNQDAKQLQSGTYSEAVKSRENVAFGFLTRHAPALLLTAQSNDQRYMAITLTQNGSLQIWYRLNQERGPDTFSPSSASLADGQFHWIRMNREGKELYVQIDNTVTQQYSLSPGSVLAPMRTLTLGRMRGSDITDEEVVRAGSRGFIGCLSSVQFNEAAPLKTALQNKGSSLVSIHGRLEESSCGITSSTNTLTTTHTLSDDSSKSDRGNAPLKKAAQNDSALIGGVVAAVVFTTLCALAVIIRYLYRHRQTPPPQVITAKNQRPSLEPPVYRPDLDPHKASRISKEYFI